MSDAQPSHLSALDGLRGIGALMVLTTHVTYSSGDAVRGPFRGVFARLDAGVALFFVVSGLLLYRPHVLARITGRSTASWRRYALRRVLRIVPAAWLAVALAALALPHPGIGVGHYLRIATMTQIYSPQPPVPGLTQLWSLSTEVAFYALLPLVVVALSRLGGARWPRRTLIALGAGPVLALAWTLTMHERVSGAANLWLPAYAGWFAAGMALAVWRETRRAGLLPRGPLDVLAEAPGTCWALAGAVYLLMTTRVAGPYGLEPATTLEAAVKNLGYAAIGLLVVLPCISPAPRSDAVRALTRWPARTLGDVSYGVFAYHLVVLGLVERAIGHRPFTGEAPVLWLATVVLVLPLAWLSHRFVEQPAVRWGRRLEARPTTR